MTYKELSDNITNIRFRVKGDVGNERGVYDFECLGKPFTIPEPRDVMLDDNQASREFIAKNWGFLIYNILCF